MVSNSIILQHCIKCCQILNFHIEFNKKEDKKHKNEVWYLVFSVIKFLRLIHLIIYLGVSIRLHVVTKEETSDVRVIEGRFTFRKNMSQYFIHRLTKMLVACSLHNIKQLCPVNDNLYFLWLPTDIL